MKRDRLLLTMLTLLLALTATSSLCAQAGDLRARMMDLPGQQPVAGALVSSTGSDHNHEPVNPHGSEPTGRMALVQTKIQMPRRLMAL